ncbi:MAG: hypothetical protein JO352_06215 [Chloroflexi bacterium]|nr:hypothetical protein [Chloroflexota bacterium]
MQGLLVAFMNPPADEDAFNAWYDEEHVPLRMGIPGFLNGRRYKAVDDTPATASTVPPPAGVLDSSSHPRYLALYDLESTKVLDSEPYTRLIPERSQRERDMIARIPFTDRRVGELVLDCPEWTRDAPYQLVVCMSPSSGGADDFVAWYREEHIPMLLAVNGWRRTRLFRQVDGHGPAFMAIHELESPQVFERPEYVAAISTPWRKRIRASVTRYERDLFQLWRPNRR